MTWMGDCLCAGKPSLYVTSYLGQLSLLSLRGIEHWPLTGVKAGRVHLFQVAGNIV